MSRRFLYQSKLGLIALFTLLPLQALAESWLGSLPGRPQHSEKATEVQMHNVTVSLPHSLDLEVISLRAELISEKPNSPIYFGALDGWRMQIEHGQINLSAQKMTELINKELTQTRAPLRIEKIITAKPNIQIIGKIKRAGVWIPFEMVGAPQLESSQTIALKPTSIKVAGVPVLKALQVAHLGMNELIRLNSEAIKLQEQGMLLNLAALMPKPSMVFALAQVSVEEGHLKATFGSTQQLTPAFCEPKCPTAFAFVQGGSIQVGSNRIHGNPVLLTSETNKLTLTLPESGDLLYTTTARMHATGGIWLNQDATADSTNSDQQFTHLQAQARTLSKGAQWLQAFTPLLGSGQAAAEKNTAILAVKDATMITPQGVPLHITHLVSTTPTVQFEQFPSSEQHILSGKIVLNSNTLDLLMNRSVFAYPGSPIREVRSEIRQPTDPQLNSDTHKGVELSMRLQVKPKLLGIPLPWLSAQLQGRLSITPDQQAMSFSPSEINLFGLPSTSLLKALGLQLDELIQVNRPQVLLKGDTLLLPLSSMLMPMTLNGSIRSISAVAPEDQGTNQSPLLQIDVGAGSNHASAKPIETFMPSLSDLPSGLWIRTKQLEANGANIQPALAYLAPGLGPLSVELGRYEQILSESKVRFYPGNQLWITPALP